MNTPKKPKAPKPGDEYRETVFLPKTDFPMRGGLPKKEPEILKRWENMDLYKTLREDSKGREQYTLHDGPPYANGNLHIGHALNKILKDVINKSWQMSGFDANYVPGWDCHGLPIEWKIEESYREQGKDKDAVPVLEFRQECREFAQHWVGVQSEEFKRLGVVGDWDDPYLTMKLASEARIAGEITRFAMNGGLYRGQRPVMWSCVEKTALADAEVEYEDHVSPTVHIGFPVVTPGPASKLEAGDCVVIWTTTPWTLPSNRAIAAAAEETYVRILVDETQDESFIKAGQTIVLGKALVEAACKSMRIEAHTVLAEMTGEELLGTIAAHPLRGLGYDYDVPVLNGDFVTMDAGTGFVHIAPGHGADDFQLGKAHGLEVTDYVAPDGAYRDFVPLFAGKRVLNDDGSEGDANAAVMDAMQVAAMSGKGGLFGRGRLKHSYPHSWRSKAPLIFRNTAQWFISMETNDLRETALQAINDTRFVPPQGRNRLYSMVEQRPDWCISRQRAWGVPIPLFVHIESGEVLKDQAVFDRIVDAFKEEGGDAWFSSPPERFLGDQYDLKDYEQVTDIVEVWFESGCTHAFVLEDRDDLKSPADLYLEGSDQHRGWFHSSLLESAGTRGRAPYDTVLTHGFVLDDKGRKMSKSLGNTTAPQDVIDQYGADILRIWVVSSNYAEDLRIGGEILKHQADLYRRVRNTLRYVLGALEGFSDAEKVDAADMPELDRWALHRLAEMDTLVRKSIEDYDFHGLWTSLHTFCAVDLSAFYFDIRKDTLYCEHPDSLARRANRSVMDAIFTRLATWLAPVLCFTAEEAWLARFGDAKGVSVHRQTFPETPASWHDEALGKRWADIRDIRRVVTGAIEGERAEKRIRSSLEAAPVVWLSADRMQQIEGVDMAEIAISSAITIESGDGPADAFRMDDAPGIAVQPSRTDAKKCVRCWKQPGDVGSDASAPLLCGRCAEVVGRLPKTLPVA